MYIATRTCNVKISYAKAPVVLMGHGPVVIVPLDDLAPTRSPLSVPPAVIVYVTSHSSPVTVTVPTTLDTGAVPDDINSI